MGPEEEEEEFTIRVTPSVYEKHLSSVLYSIWFLSFCLAFLSR